MASIRRSTLKVLAGSALLVALGGLAAHRAAGEHVSYETGLEPSTRNCFTCHFVGRGGTIADRLSRPRYRSPFKLCVSGDGRRLYATASQADLLEVVDLEAQKLIAEIPVGSRPHGVALSPDGREAYVSNEGSDSVSVIDLESARVARTLPAGGGPAALAVSPDGRSLFVGDWLDDSLRVLDLPGGTEARRLTAGANPFQAAFTPDGKRLLVANQLSRIVRRPAPPVSEVTVVGVEERAVLDRVEIPGAHLLEGIAVAPGGDLALVTLVRPKNLIPAVQVARGWMMTSGLGVIDLKSRRVFQVSLDEPCEFYADPAEVAIDPAGRLAFVSHSGADMVTAIDLERLRAVLASTPPGEEESLGNRLGLCRRFVRARIPVGANPKGLAFSPDSKRLYVAERLADRIAVIDVERLAVAGRIELGAGQRETVQRRGERLFNSASHTFQHQFSCRSCHPQNHLDRLQYDFEPDGLGLNIVDNRSLLGLDRTGPFKWNGKNTSLYMQCGMRFARFLTRVEPFPPDDLNALVAFLRSLRNPPNLRARVDGPLHAAQERGKALFERAVRKDGQPIAERDRCITCHPPPAFTNLRKADVGSISPGDSEAEFDTPQLGNVARSAPYLHDGKAATLEEIWTRFNPYDTHGITVDFTKRDLNDLIEYLKTL
jgi:YVTN family beta-propeller protein